MISIVCGIVTPSTGTITADGHDIQSDYRAARTKIGLVPQELTTDAFETVWATVTFSRGLFGKAPNPAYVEQILRDLSLWDKKDAKIMTRSGGMQRRVMIAKALSHEPDILFLDEPTAGVDVELRRDMWALVRRLRDRGVTIILTTHYIEEAEEMADRIGVINKGELILVEAKAELMRKLGKKQLSLQLQSPLAALPAEAQFTGSDDFSGETRNAAKWGPDIASGSGQLTQAGGVVRYTSTGLTDDDFMAWPWIVGTGPLDQNWSIQVDVHVPVIPMPEGYAAAGIGIGKVLSSEWCRTLETADLAFPGRARAEPAFNSFFASFSPPTSGRRPMPWR
jgi:ABC-type multidrug transport system ATPase subunit